MDYVHGRYGNVPRAAHPPTSGAAVPQSSRIAFGQMASIVRERVIARLHQRQVGNDRSSGLMICRQMSCKTQEKRLLCHLKSRLLLRIVFYINRLWFLSPSASGGRDGEKSQGPDSHYQIRRAPPPLLISRPLHILPPSQPCSTTLTRRAWHLSEVESVVTATPRGC